MGAGITGVLQGMVWDKFRQVRFYGSIAHDNVFFGKGFQGLREKNAL